MENARNKNRDLWESKSKKYLIIIKIKLAEKTIINFIIKIILWRISF